MLSTKQLQDARTDLVDFIRRVYNLLERSMTEGRDARGKLLIRMKFRPLANDAWREFQKQCSLSAAIARIHKASGYSLEHHGLYGAQLGLKFEQVKELFRRFERAGGSRILKKLLDVVDTLLESVVVATGIAGALIEIKKALSHCIEAA